MMDARTKPPMSPTKPPAIAARRVFSDGASCTKAATVAAWTPKPTAGFQGRELSENALQMTHGSCTGRKSAARRGEDGAGRAT